MQNLLHQVPPETPPPKTSVVKVHKTSRSWPLLLLGLLSYGFAGIIFAFVPPTQVQDLVIPGSYLPLLLACAFGHFMLGTFWLKNTWLGLACAATGSLLLMFRLHQALNWWLAAVCFTPVIFTKLLLTFRNHER